MTAASTPPYPLREIEIRRALAEYLKVISPQWLGYPLAEIVKRSKYGDVLCDGLVEAAVSVHTNPRKPQSHLLKRAVQDRAVDIYLEKRKARGPWRRGQNASDQELCKQAAWWYAKPADAADFVTEGLKRRKDVPPAFWPRRIGPKSLPKSR